MTRRRIVSVVSCRLFRESPRKREHFFAVKLSGVVNPRQLLVTFNDWAGQPIPYRIVPAEPGADEKLVCEIDPHGLCEWSSFGRGQNANAALQAATLAWNAYDRQT